MAQALLYQRSVEVLQVEKSEDSIMGHLKGFEQTVLGLGLTVFVSASFVACSNSKWQEVAAKTGDPIAEQQRTNTQPEDLRPGQTVYTNPDVLRGRTNPEQPPEDTPIVIERGTEVTVKDPTPQGPEGLIEVTINTKNPETPNTPDKEQTVYVPPEYISTEPVVPTNEQNSADRFFMVQNIATEKVRVYENCAEKKKDGSCVHRLVLETDMSAGEDTPDQSRRTILGSYRIVSWFKFYEDNLRLFPSWYHPSYPAVPAPGASLEEWMGKTILPSTHPKASMRGSFGWYTAHIEPNASEQWTHGTFGWGSDGDKFIQLVRDPQTNIVMDPRSQGCTRVENRAIAFMREIMPRGSKLIKIYAKEAYRDPARRRYVGRNAAKWNYALTKTGVDVEGPKSGVKHSAGVSEDQILERGEFVLDQMPDAVPFSKEGDGRIVENGNLYSIPEESYKGVFVVDEGVLVDYSHPKELKVGGHTKNYMPSILLSKNKRFVLPSAATHPGEKTKSEVLGEVPPPPKGPKGETLQQGAAAPVAQPAVRSQRSTTTLSPHK